MMLSLPRCRLLATLSLLVTAFLFAGPVPARADAVGALDAEILGLEPAVLVDGADLTLRVRVTNRTEKPVAGATLRLLAQEWTPNTRSSLARWLDEERYDATLLLSTTEVPDLAAGASHESTLTVPASAFGFDTWGPRGIEVFASAPPDADGVRPDSDRERTWVIWWNEPRVTPIGLAVLSPITRTAAELTAGADDGRIDALLRQATLPGVTGVVDPSVGTGEWALPWGNADTAALVAAGHTDLLAAAYADVGRPVDWPPVPDLETLATTPGEVLVVSDAVVAPQEFRAYTPHGVGEVAGRTAVVVDTLLSDALTGTATVDGTIHRIDGVVRSQFLAATAAVLVRERPAAARTVFASLPFDDDASRAGLLAGLADLPWVAPMTLAEALVMDARTPLDGSALPADVQLPGSAVSASDLALASDTAAELEVFEEVVGEGVLAPLLRDLALVPSLAWRDAPAARTALLREAAGTVDDLGGGLEIRGASSINLVSESANFPVTVVSTLPTDATVQLVLVPSERGLSQAEPVTVTVPAGGEVSATVPVRGVGWGDITVAIHLATSAGVQVGDAVEIPVRVRADWENIAVGGLLTFGAFAFVFGIIRTVLRNRRTGRARELEEATEQLVGRDRELTRATGRP